MQTMVEQMGQQRQARNDAYRKLEVVNARLMQLQEEYQIQRIEEMEKMEKFSRDETRSTRSGRGRFRKKKDNFRILEQ